MSNNSLSEIIDALNEVKRLQQLNYELLEQLNVSCAYLLKNYPDSPNNEKLASLMTKAFTLLDEINDKDNIRRKVTDYKSDGEVTEPRLLTFFSIAFYFSIFDASFSCVNQFHKAIYSRLTMFR